MTPLLDGGLLILFEGSLCDALELLVIELFVRFKVCFLALFQFVRLKVLHEALHHRDLITFGHELESLVLLVLTLPNIVRQWVANLLVIQIALAGIVGLV